MILVKNTISSPFIIACFLEIKKLQIYDPYGDLILTVEDGNNVDIDTEMSELSKNLLYYNVLSEKVSGEFSKLRSAITGGN